MKFFPLILVFCILPVYADGWWESVRTPVDGCVDESNVTSRVCVPLTAEDIALLHPVVLPRPLALSGGSQAGMVVADDARIRELVRGLDFDWRKCYRFVRDNIVFTPSPGLLRGAERTLIDREGSDADQAVLLKAMLNVCGLSSDVVFFPEGDSEETSYALPLYGYGGRFPINACSWLGVREVGSGSSVYEKVASALMSAGRSVSLFRNSGIDENLLFVATDHFMLMVDLPDGSRILLDPSVKAMKTNAPSDPLSDSGYSRSAVLSASGALVMTDYASGVSPTAVDAYMNARSAALRSVWTNGTASAYVGTKRIVSSDDDDVFVHGDICRIPEFVSDWSEQRRNSYRARATLSFGSTAYSFYLDELGTRRLWLSFMLSGTEYPRAVLRLDDTVVAYELSGSDIPLMQLKISVSLRGNEIHSSSAFQRSTGSVYSIIVGFSDGGHGGGMRAVASSSLSAARSAGMPDAALAMLSRTLHLAGHEWLSQVGRLSRFANDLVDFPMYDFYSVGVAGYSGSLFVDFGNRYGCSPGSNGPDVSTLFASALEHAVIEQLMGSGTSAVSTMKIFKTVNSAGDRLYAVDSGNWSRVRTQLAGYSQSELDSFGEYFALGGRMVLPRNGQVTVGRWTGCAQAAYLMSGATLKTGMLISGGLNGGYCTANVIPSAVAFDGATLNARYDDGSVTPSFSADPVAMPSGAFMDSVADLSLDFGAPLVWSRKYDSRLAGMNGPLGRGWRHGFEVSVSEGADADSVFGGGSVAAAIPTALAYMTVRDLLDDVDDLSYGEQARRWLVASCVVDWWTRRHTGASVSVSDGARSVNFQKLENGTYAPPPGVTDSLCKSNGVFVLSRRLGSTCVFDSSNRISSIVDRSGNRTEFTYDSNQLTGVRNSFGGSLSLGWRGNRIYHVTDSAGRAVSYTYDRDECMTSMRDPEGEYRRYEYDDDFRLVRFVDADRKQIVANRYDCFGRVTNQVSAVGGTTQFGYADDLCSWSVDPLGGRKEESFDEAGRLLKSIDRCGAKTVRSYDDSGHETSVRDSLDRSVLSAYDAFDRLTVVGEGTDALHRHRRYAYDARHRLIAETNALNGISSYTYDDYDRPLTKTLPDGSSEVFGWNALGLLTGHEWRSPSGDVVSTETNAYDAFGRRVAKSVGGRGLEEGTAVEALAYDAAGNVISGTDANGNVTRFGYDRCGRMTSVTDALGGVMTNVYSAAGRLTSSVDALGRRTRYRYTASGKVASVVYPDGALTTNVYNAADRLVRSVDERGRTVDFAYDAEGRMISNFDAFGTNVVVRDVLGRVTAETNAVGFAESVAYDDLDHATSRVDCVGSVWRSRSNRLGWTLAVTNPLEKVTRYTYNRVGDRIGYWRPSGASEWFGYDVNGNIIAYTNAEGHVTTRAFDGLGRQLSETDACGRLRFTNRYDRVGNLVSGTDGEGYVTTCDYDALNRLVRRESPDAVETFGYDPVGNLISSSNDIAATSFAYDLRDRLVSASSAVGTNVFSTVWQRDAGGLVTNFVCGSDMPVAKAYDLRGRLTSVRVGGHEWTFAYDAENRLVGGASPDGVNRSLAYDGCGSVTEWSVGSLAGRTITRDAAGRRIRDDVTAGPMPTPPSRRLARNVFDESDRLVSASVKEGGVTFSESYLYDANGALTNILADGESVFNASYDASGRLVSLGTNGWHCAYDALGNRVRMSDRIFLPDYDDQLKRPLIECAADGSVIRRYLWGPTGFLGFIDANDELTVAHSDEQGSVIVLTDIDGNVLFRANYGPYGEDWGSSGSNPTPFFWLGGLGVMRIDPTSLSSDPSSLIPDPSSLYLTRHRLYSPVLRRFLSADPLGFAGGANVYAYADGNPLAYVDPLGLCADDAGFLSYLGDSAEQVLLGNFTDKVTGLGTAGEVAAGVFGIDLLMDVRDIGYDLTHWENSWGHVGKTGLDVAGVLPLVGVLKYGDEVGALTKRWGKKAGKSVGGESLQLRKLSQGEIQTMIRAGVHPHELKINSRYDLFKNENGDIFVKPKSGIGPGEETGLNIFDF